MPENNHLTFRFVSVLLALFITAASARAQIASSPPALSTTTLAAPATDRWGLTLPTWLTATSAAAKEGYDTNIFGTTTNPTGHPAVANIKSGFTTLSTNLTFDFLAAAGTQGPGFLTNFTLGYAADYTVFDQAAREDNLRNTFSLQVKGKSGPWSFSIDNPLIYVDGSKEDIYYNTFTTPGFQASLQRRNQVQERNASFLRYDTTHWFLRAVDSAAYYNLLINEHNPVGPNSGYINWVNRDDINTGVDLGYKPIPSFALTAGWRIGQQTQAHTYYNLVQNNNTYNRALFGFEGLPWPWLKASFVAGPDFRRYSNAAHLGLSGDRHTWLYTESSLTATFTPVDTLTAANKIWHFVAAPGSTSDQETADSLLYKHIFTKKISASVGVKIIGFRFDAPTVRNDWSTTYPLDLTYAFNAGLALSADYSITQGRSHFPDAVARGRDWDENIASLTLKASF